MGSTALIKNMMVGVGARTEQFDRKLGTSRKNLGAFSKQATAAKVALGGLNSVLGLFGASAGVQTLINFGTESVVAFQESRKASAKLESVLNATGFAAGFSAGQIEEYAEKLSVLVGVDDDLITSSAGVLATFKNVNGTVFKDAIRLGLDMTAVMGGDLQGAMVQFGKALNDPTQGISALTRVGVSFTDQQKEQIRLFQESGDLMSAQKIIIAELQSEFGGAAEATATQADKLGVAWGNLKEAIGSFSEVSGIVDVLKQLTEGLTIATDEIKAAREAFGQGNSMGGLSHLNSLTPIGMMSDYLVATLAPSLVPPVAAGPAGPPRRKAPEEVDLGQVFGTGGGPQQVMAPFANPLATAASELSDALISRIDNALINSTANLQSDVTMREFERGPSEDATASRPGALLRGTSAAFSASFGAAKKKSDEQQLAQQKEQTRVLKEMNRRQQQVDQLEVATIG